MFNLRLAVLDSITTNSKPIEISITDVGCIFALVPFLLTLTEKEQCLADGIHVTCVFVEVVDGLKRKQKCFLKYSALLNA